jgi:ABC-type branched-subunit amino acid transport system ATPase component
MGFAVAEGELVTLLGRNGAGKTTTLKAIMGIVPQRRGSVGFRGTELVGLASNRIAGPCCCRRRSLAHRRCATRQARGTLAPRWAA